MARPSKRINIYLEAGSKKTFAGAIDWPGWARSGPDEPSAIQSLFEYGRRYQQVVAATQPGFRAPSEVSKFDVVERLEGNSTTDFGAPDASPSQDTAPVGQVELLRFQNLLKGAGRRLTGWSRQPRARSCTRDPGAAGGTLNKSSAMCSALRQPIWGGSDGNSRRMKSETWIRKSPGRRRGVLMALAASVRGELPARGPRRGLHWRPRYFVRRVAWHVLDHAWEIEDRSS